MRKRNEDIREYVKSKGLYLWQIAEACNISPETLNKRLRHEFNQADKERLIKIIDSISEKGE